MKAPFTAALADDFDVELAYEERCLAALDAVPTEHAARAARRRAVARRGSRATTKR